MHAPCSTYRAAIFDLDGTLIDSTEAIVASTARALEELGWPPLPPEVIARHIGYKLEAVFPERSPAERRRLIEVIGRHYTGVCAARTRLCPGMGDLVHGLAARGVPLGIVTSKRRDHSEIILKALGVRDRFRVLIGSEDVARMKPDPEGLRRAVTTLGVPPAACLYVGDTRVDVETARGAGVAVAGVGWGTDGLPVLEAEGVDHAVHEARALAPLFG